MKLSITDKKGREIACRIFDAKTGKWYTGTAWSSVEAQAYLVTLNVIELSNEFEDRYVGEVSIPDGGPYTIEYIDKTTKLTIAEEETPDLSEKEVLDDIKREATLARKLQSNKAVISEDGSKVTIYDDDQTTILYVFNVTLDQKTRIPE